MRLMQLASFYPNYLTEFYGRNLSLAAKPSVEQVEILLEDGFGASHMIAPYMRALGYEAQVVIGNAIGAQTQWALEHGLPAPTSHTDLLKITAAQIETFKPDILYSLDPTLHDTRFLSTLSHRPRLCVGWRAAPIPLGSDWTRYDLVLSSDEGYRKLGMEHGAKMSDIYRPGFPRSIAERVAHVPKSADISFCGQITGEHPDRIRGLTLLSRYAGVKNLTLDYRLGIRPTSDVPDELRKLDRGAVYGMEMYRSVKAGRITPNFHIAQATSRGQNMRLFEVTGIGSFMLTEADDQLGEQFEIGREVETYSSTGELLEKIEFYLENEVAREEIARRGQERCLNGHSMEGRAKWLHEIFEKALRSAPAIPTRAIARTVTSEGRLDVAEVLLNDGKVSESIDILNRVLHQEPRHVRGLTIFGHAMAASGQTERAQQVLAAARQLGAAQETAKQTRADDPLTLAFPGVSFGHDVQCIGIGSTRIGRGACVGDGVWMNACIHDNKPRIVVGENVLVGRRSVLSSGSYLEIGAYTLLAPNVYIASADHNYETNHLVPLMYGGTRDYGSVVIEENCWLGMNAIVSGNYTMGRGSILGANSVLRDSLPPFCLAVGAPARIVRMLNPVSQAWEDVRSAEDRARIEEARKIRPLPTREELLVQLRKTNAGRPILPIVGGRGEHRR